MKEINKPLKKILMWHKVNELAEKGLNKTQIGLELNLHRQTVNKYLGMSEQEFLQWLDNSRTVLPLLQPYYQFVKKRLKQHDYLSAAQIEDQLKEHFDDFPSVHPKTIYNFVCRVRREEGIRKPKLENQRLFQKLDELAYGQEAQMDFGVFNMQDGQRTRRKVWFFAMVLSRSRHKFVYFQTNPFTTESTVELCYLQNG